jgi:DNA-binding CsgD family transcriptional regulator
MESRTTRADHLKELLSREYGWSPRQRQVLELMTRGRSNQEIADELGVSLDGAKWHVREIFAKLGVDSRDEAAEYWRARNGLRLRFSRLARALVPGTAWAKAVLGTATLAGLGLATAFVVIALQTTGGEPGVADAPPAVATATVIASASPTVSAPPTPGAPLTVTGLFDDPRQTTPARTIQPPPAPPSPFKDWDGVSTVIYDTQTLKETNLGPGSLPSFSPDAQKAIWVAGDNAVSGHDGEILLVELPTGVVTTLGISRSAWFVDNDTVAFFEPGDTTNSQISLDLRTGMKTPSVGGTVASQPTPTPYGYRITQEKAGPKGEYRIVSVLGPSGEILMPFDALNAIPADANHIAVQTRVNSGTTNVFLIDLKTGAAQFLGTARIPNSSSLILANARQVIWFDNFCSITEQQQAMVFQRANSELLAVDLPSNVAFTPDGRLLVARFGGGALLDPITFAATATIPPAGDIRWSPDYRYAAHGQTGGHDGPCV